MLYLTQDCFDAQLIENPAYGKAESNTNCISKMDANPAYGASRKSMCLGTRPSMQTATYCLDYPCKTL